MKRDREEETKGIVMRSKSSDFDSYSTGKEHKKGEDADGRKRIRVRIKVGNHQVCSTTTIEVVVHFR